MGILMGAALLFALANLVVVTVFHHHVDSEADKNHHVIHVAESSKRTQSTALYSNHDAEDRNLEPIPRPPLRSIVQGWNITGDPSWLVQFAIVGFPKSGTSTLMFHLREHPEIHMFQHERCELASNQQVLLIEDMYRQFPPSTTHQRFLRGIKCPMYLENPQLSMMNFRKFFPTTDFIVGIRHPVLWYVVFGRLLLVALVFRAVFLGLGHFSHFFLFHSNVYAVDLSSLFHQV